MTSPAFVPFPDLDYVSPDGPSPTTMARRFVLASMRPNQVDYERATTLPLPKARDDGVAYAPVSYRQSENMLVLWISAPGLRNGEPVTVRTIASDRLEVK